MSQCTLACDNCISCAVPQCGYLTSSRCITFSALRFGAEPLFFLSNSLHIVSFSRTFFPDQCWRHITAAWLSLSLFLLSLRAWKQKAVLTRGAASMIESVVALPKSDPKIIAMLSQAFESVELEWNPPPCPEACRLDDWSRGGLSWFSAPRPGSICSGGA